MLRGELRETREQSRGWRRRRRRRCRPATTSGLSAADLRRTTLRVARSIGGGLGGRAAGTRTIAEARSSISGRARRAECAKGRGVLARELRERRRACEPRARAPCRAAWRTMLASTRTTTRPGELRAHAQSPRGAGCGPCRRRLDEERAALAAERGVGALLARLEVRGAPDEARAREEALGQPPRLGRALVGELADDVEPGDDLGRARGPRERIGVEERRTRASSSFGTPARAPRAAGGSFQRPAAPRCARPDRRGARSASSRRARRARRGRRADRAGRARRPRAGTAGGVPATTSRAPERGERAEVEQLAVPVGRHAHVARGSDRDESAAARAGATSEVATSRRCRHAVAVRAAAPRWRMSCPDEELHRVERARPRRRRSRRRE